MSEQPYDPASRCPKCGYAVVAETYVSWLGQLPIERIRRDCGRCAHHWNELPVDHDWDLEQRQVMAYIERTSGV